MLTKCPNCPKELGCWPECERPAPTITTNGTVPPQEYYCPHCGNMVPSGNYHLHNQPQI